MIYQWPEIFGESYKVFFHLCLQHVSSYSVIMTFVYTVNWENMEPKSTIFVAVLFASKWSTDLTASEGQLA